MSTIGHAWNPQARRRRQETLPRSDVSFSIGSGLTAPRPYRANSQQRAAAFELVFVWHATERRAEPLPPSFDNEEARVHPRALPSRLFQQVRAVSQVNLQH